MGNAECGILKGLMSDFYTFDLEPGLMYPHIPALADAMQL